MTQSDQFDVVIAGGGLVGGSLAIALAQTDCRIALVEAVPPESDAQPSFDDRTLALARGSCRVLEQLKVWQRIQDSVWAIEQIHVSQQGRFGTAVIDAAEQGIAQLGYVIKSHQLGQAIWAVIRALPNVEVFCPATVTATALVDAGREVELDMAGHQQTLNAKLLVVADGARSKLRSALGINAQERNYEQVAVVANIRIDPKRAGKMAYERFTSQGPLAILPGKDGRYTLVLARNSASVSEVMDMPDEALIELVQSLFGFRLGRIRQIGKRQAYPLYLVTAESVAAERAIVIGNAANGLHPVAAQGFNLGLRDAASLAELVADTLRDNEIADVGVTGLVEAYVAWRQDDQRRVVQFTDSLIRYFGVPGMTAAAARGLSLAAFDVLPAAKRELARQTMGQAGRMTRLARGLPL